MHRQHRILMALALAAGVALPGRPAAAATETIASGSQTLWLRSDGTVWACGDAGPVRGDTGEQPRTSFAQVAGLEGIVAIAVATESSDSAAAIDRSGTVWLWGDLREVVAQGGEEHRPAPFPAVGPARSIALGGDHGVVLGTDGKVRTFGDNRVGQLGVADPRARGPLVVQGLDDVVAVGAYNDTSFMLRRDGTLWGMGSAFFGLLGKEGKWNMFGGDLTANPRPVRIEGLTDVVSFSVGDSHGLAVDREGVVWGWGGNEDAQLASPPQELVARTPFRLPGMPRARAVAAGYDFTLVLAADGTVWGRGGNVYGTLGDGKDDLEADLRRIAGLADVEAVFAGHYSAFARTSGGRVLGWGTNDGYVGGFSAAGAQGARLMPTLLDVRSSERRGP